MDGYRRVLVGVLRLTWAVIAVLLLPPVGLAQDVSEAALKAAYIYHFAKFTEWPDGAVAPDAPIFMCVVGDAVVSEELGRAVAGRKILGRRMEVSLAGPEGPRGACHILYVSRVKAAQAAAVVAGLRDRPVLTISDIEGFAASGGIAEFFFVRGRLRFSVHLASVKRARLQISSRLLVLAVQR